MPLSLIIEKRTYKCRNKFKNWSTQFERTERIAKNITQYEYFVTYDPYTYWRWIAAMSGTVSVVYPLQGKSKYEWLMSTFVGPYLKASNKTNLPGIAYGWTSSEIDYARRTMHQLRPMLLYIIRKLFSRRWTAEYLNFCLLKGHFTIYIKPLQRWCPSPNTTHTQ